MPTANTLFTYILYMLDEIYVSYHTSLIFFYTVRVHYKSMKCDVSFSLGSISKLLDTYCTIMSGHS